MINNAIITGIMCFIGGVVFALFMVLLGLPKLGWSNEALGGMIGVFAAAIIGLSGVFFVEFTNSKKQENARRDRLVIIKSELTVLAKQAKFTAISLRRVTATNDVELRQITYKNGLHLDKHFPIMENIGLHIQQLEATHASNMLNLRHTLDMVRGHLSTLDKLTDSALKNSNKFEAADRHVQTVIQGAELLCFLACHQISLISRQIDGKAEDTSSLIDEITRDTEETLSHMDAFKHI